MEGGHCSDTNFEGKLAEKTVQHERLVGILRTYRDDVWLRPVPLGYAGTTYISKLSVLQELGLNRSAAKSMLKKLHLHAISCLHNIIQERKYLEGIGRYAMQARGRGRNLAG